MNAIVLSFADGTTFFVGLFVVMLAEFLFVRFNKGLVRAVLTVLVLVGIILVVISATPFPIWAYVLWLVPATSGLILGNLANSLRRSRIIVGGLLLAATAGLALAEAPFHCLPRVTVPKGKTIYVLGDSISAGMGTKHRCWPTMLSERTSLQVVNLSRPGATIESAITQAEGIAESDSVVIVEIGGNDILAFGTDAGSFKEQLELLVSSLRANKHQMLMMELPLPPFQNSFGVAQRSIAAKYDVAMLPKRYFAKVLGTKNGTLDGLHLSQEGHNTLAEIIAEVIQKE